MTIRIIKIGNSKGIKIPKNILQRIGLKDEVEIEVKDNRIILKAASKIRDNWEIAFQKMSKSKVDILLDKEYLENSNSWDNEEWQW